MSHKLDCCLFYVHQFQLSSVIASSANVAMYQLKYSFSDLRHLLLDVDQDPSQLEKHSLLQRHSFRRRGGVGLRLDNVQERHSGFWSVQAEVSHGLHQKTMAFEQVCAWFTYCCGWHTCSFPMNREFSLDHSFQPFPILFKNTHMVRITNLVSTQDNHPWTSFTWGPSVECFRVRR